MNTYNNNNTYENNNYKYETEKDYITNESTSNPSTYNYSSYDKPSVKIVEETITIKTSNNDYPYTSNYESYKNNDYKNYRRTYSGFSSRSASYSRSPSNERSLGFSEKSSLNRNRVWELARLNGNNRCFDCNKDNTSWVDLTFFVFLCQDCAKQHMILFPNSNHRIRSIDVNEFTWTDLSLLKAGGNNNLRNYLSSYGIMNDSYYNSYSPNSNPSMSSKYLNAAVAYYIKHVIAITTKKTFRKPKLSKEDGLKSVSYNTIEMAFGFVSMMKGKAYGLVGHKDYQQKIAEEKICTNDRQVMYDSYGVNHVPGMHNKYIHENDHHHLHSNHHDHLDVNTGMKNMNIKNRSRSNSFDRKHHHINHDTYLNNNKETHILHHENNNIKSGNYANIEPGLKHDHLNTHYNDNHHDMHIKNPHIIPSTMNKHIHENSNHNVYLENPNHHKGLHNQGHYVADNLRRSSRSNSSERRRHMNNNEKFTDNHHHMAKPIYNNNNLIHGANLNNNHPMVGNKYDINEPHMHNNINNNHNINNVEHEYKHKNLSTNPEHIKHNIDHKNLNAQYAKEAKNIKHHELLDNNSIHSSRSSSFEKDLNKTEKSVLLRQKIRDLIPFHGNKSCADCGVNNVNWVNTMFGTFYCGECARNHRIVFPKSHNNVKSLEASNFKNKELALMKAGGNDNFHHFLGSYGIKHNTTSLESKYLFNCVVYYIKRLITTSKGKEFKHERPIREEGLRSVEFSSLFSALGFGAKIKNALGIGKKEQKIASEKICSEHVCNELAYDNQYNKGGIIGNKQHVVTDKHNMVYPNTHENHNVHNAHYNNVNPTL